ncbi:MAG: endonuclease III [Candidatus Thorarchaeota archaeon]|nr:endonuclease III [Candidatus Thorarchaeota archaeon]
MIRQENTSTMDDKKRIQKVLYLLDAAYPDAPLTYLNHSNPFEMVIATLLSAHTTDACVNIITPILFEKYPTPQKMAEAPLDSLKEIICPCGTYNRKSAYIRDSARLLVENFDSEVPKTMEELVQLPGVSRKTANVVLSVAFGKNEGVVVDTHVLRVTQRLGFTKQRSNRNKVEKDLMNLLPQDLWYEYARLVGAHGRQTCDARNPKCPVCAVKDLCPSAMLETSMGRV